MPTTTGTNTLTYPSEGATNWYSTWESFAQAITNYLDAINAATNVEDLDDVTITSIASGEILKWSGSAWVNQTLAEAGIAAATHTHTMSDITDAGSLATASTVNNSDWSGTDLAVANGGTGSSTASAARTALGVAIGSDVQAYDADLAAIAALTPTKGKIMVGNGSAWTSLSVGSNDEVLTADSGQSTGVKWAEGSAGGGMVLLSSQTAASSSSIDFTSVITTTYDAYRLVISGIRASSGSNEVALRLSTDNGSTWISGGTAYDLVTLTDGTASSFANSSILLGGNNHLSNGTNDHGGFVIDIFSPTDAGVYTLIRSTGTVVSAGAVAMLSASAAYTTAADTDAIQVFFAGGGNIVEGEFQLFGISNS